MPTPEWRGRLAYAEALDQQRTRREAVIVGDAPEAVWLLEHDPVVTLGRRPVTGLDQEALNRRGWEVVPTERGGLATWHGPGQLVGYLILDVGRRGLGTRRMVEAIEQGLIDWLATRDVVAARREGAPGVWVGTDKIGAIGLHLRMGVTLHGFALNLDPDLGGFGDFVPCGILDGGVTSFARLRGHSPTPREAAFEVGSAVVDAIVRAIR